MSKPVQRLPLALRQQQLLARSAELRTRLETQVQPLQRPLHWADMGHQAWQWVCARPAIPLGVAAAVLIARPRRAWGLGMSLWWGWRQWRRLQHWLDGGAPSRGR